MKKNFCKLIICGIFIFGASLLFAENARVTYVKGKVEVLRNNSWAQLSVGDILEKADTVSTGFQSEAKIEYGGSLMSLGALTRVTIENLSSSEKKDNVSVYLNTGAVRSKVTHTQEKRVAYQVKSPVAVASVRGTDFTITASGQITCNEGAVVVYPNTEIFGMRDSGDSDDAESVEEESPDESLDNVENPGDYGPATPVTPASEIAENVPAGALVVGKDQSVFVNNVGASETPMQHAYKEVDKNSTVTTAATQEAVVVGGSSGSDSQPGISNSTTIPTGSLYIDILFE